MPTENKGAAEIEIFGRIKPRIWPHQPHSAAPEMPNHRIGGLPVPAPVAKLKHSVKSRRIHIATLRAVRWWSSADEEFFEVE